MFRADQDFALCFACFRGSVSRPPEVTLSFQKLVRFALDSKEPHPDAWFGAALPHQLNSPHYVWCLGSDNLTDWVKIAHLEPAPVQTLAELQIPEADYEYPSIDAAIMACIHRRPKLQRKD